MVCINEVNESHTYKLSDFVLNRKKDSGSQYHLIKDLMNKWTTQCG